MNPLAMLAIISFAVLGLVVVVAVVIAFGRTLRELDDVANESDGEWLS